MVVAPADHGTQADVMFVIEGTAINGAYMNDLKTNYVLPTLEYFSQGALEDYVCESTSTMYGLVVYQAADCLPNPSSDCYGPYTSPQKVLHMLDRIELIGGKGESHANIAEGLATALQCFEDLQQRRDNNNCISQKHCILVCNSPPYQLPVVDSPAFAGNTVDQLANILAERGINLSILSPRKIPALFKLYEKAGGDLQASQTKNYAKDPRHLVLLKGYNLKERPISPGPGSAPGPPAHPNSLPLPSISSPLPSTGSPVAPPQTQTVFRQTQQAPQVMGISQAQPNAQQQVSQQQQQVSQQQQQQVQQQVSQQQAQQQVTQLQVVQQQQQQVQQQVTQQQMANQQQVPTPGVPQGLGGQGRAPGPQPYPQQGPPSYLPPMMSNRPPGRWPMMPPQRAQFPTASGGSALIAQLTQPPSMGPQFNILGQTQGGLNQQQQANQQVQQQTAQQVQQQQVQQQAQQQSNQQQPQSVQQQTNQQQAQSVQQQTNQQQSQSIQQQQAQQQQAQQQVQQQAGGMRMIAQQNGPQGGTLGSLGPQQVSVPVSSSAPGQPVQPGPPLAGRERQTIWQGLLEWIEKAKMPSDNQKQTRHVPCQVSANAKDGEPELKADNWPQKLIMQLMPKQLIGNIGGAYLKNSKSVLFHPQQCEALDSLTKVMSSGFAGCVHFTSVISPSACDIKVLILLYTAEKRAYLGFIPNDQAAFVDRLRKVIQHQKSTQAMMRQGQGGAAGQPGVPNGPMNPGQPGNAMGNSMGQQGGPLGGGMNPQQGGAGGLGQLGGPLGSQASGQIGGLLNSQLQGGLGGAMNPQQGSALSNALGGNQVGGGGQGGGGANPGGGASGLMQAMAGVGNASSQNQTPPQTPAGQQPPTSLGIQFPLQGSAADQARAAAAAAAVAAAAAGQGGAPGGLMGQRPPFGIEVARQENLAKIQHLRKTLEQAQAQELQYKNQLEIISHMKIQQLQQSLEVAQQQEVQYKSQLEQEQQKQLRAQLQQIQQQRGMAPQQGSQGGPGGPPGGAQPGGPTAPQQQRMMRPGISNNPGLRHLLQQQQPQYRQQVLSMNPQQMPRTQQGIPNQQQSQQQFDEASFDFLN